MFKTCYTINIFYISCLLLDVIIIGVFMEYLIIISISIFCLIILAIIYDVKINTIKKIKELSFSKELDEITNKLPKNIVVCEEILKQIGNFGKVKVIQDENKNAKASLYIVATNTISIANINGTCTRIQTIAHECVHSIQNKKLLMFNFIFSNIYILYFLVICILTFFNKIQNPLIQIYILTLLSFIYYKVRSFLETDAMTKAPFVAEKYMENSKILNENEITKIMDSYKIINNLGIKIANLELFAKCIFKIIIYAFLCFI